MTESPVERLAPLSGAVFVVLFTAAALLFNNYDYLPPPSEIQAFLTDNATRLQVAAYFGLVSAAFLGWFAGSLRHSLRPTERGTGRLSAVAFGGGIASASLVALAFSVLFVAAARAGSAGGISPDAAAVLNDLYGTIGGSAFPVTMAIMLGASAVVVLRTGVWPSWVAWTGAALAVASLTPFAYIAIGFDLLWVLVVSILLYMRGRPASSAPEFDPEDEELAG